MMIILDTSQRIVAHLASSTSLAASSCRIMFACLASTASPPPLPFLALATAPPRPGLPAPPFHSHAPPVPEGSGGVSRITAHCQKTARLSILCVHGAPPVAVIHPLPSLSEGDGSTVTSPEALPERRVNCQRASRPARG